MFFNKIKKPISSVTIFALLGTAIIPVNLNATIFDDALVSTNQARVWEDKTSGTKNYYSGSVYIRFAPSTPPPIIKISAPEVQASCNGINIKGMFVSILNLDQLGAMLQNAGASLAWGVAVGLIYSLPGIANAFKMINDWAKRIQQILGAACQSGIVLGKKLAESAGIDKTALQKKVDSYIDNAAETMQEGASGVAKALYLDKIQFDQNGIIDISGDQKLDKKDAIDALQNMIINGLISNISLGGSIFSKLNEISNGSLYKNLGLDLSSIGDNEVAVKKIYINSTLSHSDTDDVSRTVSQLIINDANIGDLTIQNKWKTIFAFYFYINQAIGDIYINNKIDTFIKGIFNYLNTDEQQDKEEALDKIQNPEKNVITITADGGSSINDTAKDFASLIVKGFIDTYNYKVPVTNFHVINLIGFHAEGLSSNEAINVLSSDKYSSELDFSGWYGAKVAAKCAIKDLLGELSSDPNVTTDSGVEVACSSVNSPIFPSFEQYRIISLNSPETDRPKLKEVLTKYVESHYAVDLANYLVTALRDDFTVKMQQLKNAQSSSTSTSSSSGVQQSSSRAPSEKTSALINNIATYTNKINDFLNKFLKEVKKISVSDSEVVSKDELDKIFNEQRIKNKTRGLKNVISQ